MPFFPLNGTLISSCPSKVIKQRFTNLLVVLWSFTVRLKSSHDFTSAGYLHVKSLRILGFIPVHLIVRGTWIGPPCFRLILHAYNLRFIASATYSEEKCYLGKFNDEKPSLTRTKGTLASPKEGFSYPPDMRCTVIGWSRFQGEGCGTSALMNFN